MILVEKGYKEYCRMIRKKACEEAKAAKEEKRLFKINQMNVKSFEDWTDEELLI